MKKYEYLQEISVGLIDTKIRKFEEEKQIDESTVATIFSCLDNGSISNILAKVIVLNQLYSAGLNDSRSDVKQIMPDVFMVAECLQLFKHEFGNIISQDKAIDIIVKMNYCFQNQGKTKATSFISKFLFWTNEIMLDEPTQNTIPIYDSKVKGMLYFYGMRLRNNSVIRNQLSNYSYYCYAHNKFLEYCNTIGKHYSTRQIDKFLWQYSADVWESFKVDLSM